MLLLTQDQRARLIANGKTSGDHAPVVKFFSPVGAATWLFLDDYPTASLHSVNLSVRLLTPHHG